VARRIVQLLSHSIEAYDMLRLYHSLGHEVFDIGGYIDPRAPHDDKRPALPEVPFYPELKKAIDDLGTPDNLGAAQSRIPDKILDWADTIVMHHYLERLYGQWPRIRDWLKGDSNRRVIWRSVGQSVENNELMAQPFRREGLERVAYSPKEQNIPGYAGHDALIRFFKDPDEWCGWTGENAVVANVTQHLYQRGPYTNYEFWKRATDGLPTQPAGPGSEEIGGLGPLSYDEMREYLRKSRVYLYTGTQPASYTLGLIEAMMSGIPVVSIGPSWMNIFPYGPALFEGHEITGDWFDDPAKARAELEVYLTDPACAMADSQHARDNAMDLFSMDNIREQWQAFLA